MSCSCNSNPCCCQNQPPARSNCPPSPAPPWSRPLTSPLKQTILGDDSIDLTKQMSILSQTTPKDSEDPTVPYAVTLPNGNSLGQVVEIYINRDKSPDTALFLVTGTFVGFSTLLFNSTGFSAVLKWVGDAWTVVGGNALLE